MAERFDDPVVRKKHRVGSGNHQCIEPDPQENSEWHIEKTARQHDYLHPVSVAFDPWRRADSVLVILYEVHDVRRFPRVQDFSSYARLIRPVKESDGKMAGHSNKNGNHHLKWAVKEAAILMLRDSAEAKYFVSKLERKYNKGKALGIFTHKLPAIYFMLKNKEAFDMKRFFDNRFEPEGAEARPN